MDLNRVDPIVFQRTGPKEKESENILTDPHFYLCFVFAGILLVMSLFACSHAEPIPKTEAVSTQEAGATHK